MKFLREAQKRVVKAMLRRKLAAQGAPPLSEAELDRQSERLLEEAQRVLKNEGSRLLAEVKEGLRQRWDKRG